MCTSFPLEQDGLWVELKNHKTWQGKERPALFLDRDGVINFDTGYVSNPDDIKLTPWIREIICLANKANYPVIIITNQSGVGRGYYGWQEFQNVQDRILSELQTSNAHIDLVLACAYHKDAEDIYKIEKHPMRKPKPGMILRATQLLPINLEQSILIGDRQSDLEAGLAADLLKTYFVGEDKNLDKSFLQNPKVRLMSTDPEFQDLRKTITQQISN